MDPEFPESPSKRRRTMSPEESSADPVQPSEPPTSASTTAYQPPQPNPAVKEEIERKIAAENNFLDVLMQEVEAQSGAMPAPGAKQVGETAAESSETTGNEVQHLPTNSGLHPVDGNATIASEPTATEQNCGDAALPAKAAADTDPSIDTLMQQVESQAAAAAQPTETELTAATAATAENESALRVDALTPSTNALPGLEPPADSEATRAAAPETNGDIAAAETSVESTQAPAEREWETDSSPYSSDTSSDDSSSDEDSDEDADGDYAMLDPEEAARILMQDDGGSDDEGRSKDPGRAGLRTAHEQVEEVIPKPNITVTETTEITELGNVEFVVENTVLIRGKTSGEYQVLESGSALCLKDRTVIGAIAETIGRVEEPMYTVRFTNEEAIQEAGVSEKGTTVYYVVPHSKFVFTHPLRTVKGSDASNFHDEEVGAEEMEFSDDEKEAEHKRQLKQKRQGRKDDGGRGGRGRGRGGPQSNGRLPPVPETNGGVSTLDYDDNGEGYTPLARPANLHETFSGIEPEPGEVSDQPQYPQQASRGSFQNNRGGRGRGRGNFNRGGRGGNNRGRGGFSHQSPQHYQQQPPPFPFPTGQFPPFQGQMPSAPQISPQGSAPYGMPFSPSPISPLPNGPFNFQAPQFPGFGAMPPPPPPPVPGYGTGQAGQQMNQAGILQMQEMMRRIQQQQQQQRPG